jgi:hypothetical protein
VRIIHKEGMAQQSQTIPAGKHKSIVDVAKRVVAHLRKRCQRKGNAHDTIQERQEC